MITGHVFIATSLDGFIARENGEIDWLLERDEASEDHGYAAFIRDIDAIIMGRGTFETVHEMGVWAHTLPVLVLSKTLSQQPVPPALAGTVRFSDASPQQAMAMLEAEGCRHVYVDGGQVIRSFLALRLIRDLVITRIPVLLGAGRPLFGGVADEVPLIHEGTISFPSGLVQSRYTVER